LFAGGSNPRTPLGRVILGLFLLCFGGTIAVLAWVYPHGRTGTGGHSNLVRVGVVSFFAAWSALILLSLREDFAILRHPRASTDERSMSTHRFDDDLNVPLQARLLGSGQGRLVVRFEAAEHELVAWNLDVEVRDANGIVVASESAELSTADHTPRIERVFPRGAVWPLTLQAAVRVETSRQQIAESRASCEIELFAMNARIEAIAPPA